MATHPKTVSHFGRVTVVTKPHGSHNRLRNTLMPTTFPTRFFGELHFDRLTHQQERLSPIYLPVEASSENTYSRIDLQSGAKIQAPASEALFGRAPPLTGLSAIDESIQPLHAPCRRRKGPNFPLFLYVDCF